MKYMSWILGLLGLGAGFGAGFYVGKKKEERMYEADIASVKEEYQKKLEETKKRMQEAYGNTEPEDGDKQDLTPNGDINDSDIEVTTYAKAVKHNMEDVVYFAKDNVWYNQDKEVTYDKNNVFDVPIDLFAYFGEGADKTTLVYIYNKKTEEYFCLRYNPGSYVSNVLGYDDSSEGGKEE